MSLDQFKATYIAESNELLADMETFLLELDIDNPSNDDLNAIFRCAHSIKGGAGAFGLNYITSFTHILETLLDAMRDGDIEPSKDNVDVLLRSVDVVREMIRCATEGAEPPAGLGEDVATELNRICKEDIGIDASSKAPVGANPAAASDTTTANSTKEALNFFRIVFTPNKDMPATGNEPLLILRELASYGELNLTADCSEIPNLSELDPERCYIKWNAILKTERNQGQVMEAFEFVIDECKLEITKLTAEEIAAESLTAESGNSKSEIAKDATKSDDYSDPDGAYGLFGDDAAEGVTDGKVAAAGHPTTENAVPAGIGDAGSASVKKAAANSNQTANSNNQTAQNSGVGSIRVDLDKVDRLVNMVGELVITQAMISAQTRELPVDKYPELIRGVDELAHHTRELQEAVMSVRMQPVKSIFSRMPRIVRDIAGQLKKDIRLVMQGESTEVDKTVIEQLSDPLTHMIRNAADHGVETPEERRAKGKPAQGVVNLSAQHQGGKIIIEIRDDGAGINVEKITAKARDKGIISAEAKLTNEEACNLIFHPGFSTAEQVSNISGRGVGMDVVKRNIEGMGGNVSITSEYGKGSTFTITLPLTLAILDGMIVRVGGEYYIIPITSIIETLRPTESQMRPVPDGSDLLNVRGEFVPVIYLHQIFGVSNATHEPWKALVVLAESGRERVGIVVDELVGQQQVVIKSLEANSDPVDGISGATILGDGKVSLIIDVGKLHALEQRQHRFRNLKVVA